MTDEFPTPLVIAIMLLACIAISFLAFLAFTGQLKGRDWEQLCRNRADKYELVYIDTVSSTKCWALQPSGDLINLWQE